MESRELEQLFSAMPPLEALKLLCSLKVSLKMSCRGKPLKLAHFDISRAHFMPKARHELYVELFDEDPMKQKGCVKLLLRSMYGTQDASNLWQEDYSGTLAQRGYVPGQSNPAVFLSHRGDGRMLVHGDDFVLLAASRGTVTEEQVHSKGGVCDWRWKFATGSSHSEQDCEVRAAEQVKQDGDGNRARSAPCGHLGRVSF